MKADIQNNPCLICVDAGTTNTRVWLLRGEQVIAKAQAMVGVRDTARDGSPARLHQTLRELIAQVRTGHQPSCVIAAGMITSPLGLVEVPHIPAPAGLDELAAAIQHHAFPDITDLPILLVPGVRCGPAPCDHRSVSEADVIRGEETLIAGLVAQGRLTPNATLLNIGSHWKAMRLDDRSRIASSVTSMSGELIHTAQTQTILADALPHERPEELDPDWLEAGMREQRQSGLARALFCVRLLHQRSESSPDQRFAFLAGAFIASDLDALLARGRLHAPVTITGSGAVARAWQSALASAAIPSVLLNEMEAERAMFAGFQRIVTTGPTLSKIREAFGAPRS